MPDSDGISRPIHWEFVLDARLHPARPGAVCPTLVLHGLHDTVVPIESSRRWASEHPARVRLVELDDDHLLARSFGHLAREALSFWALDPRTSQQDPSDG
jgi:pimeloyl-ACP methyl ester carboxylesterase